MKPLVDEIAESKPVKRRRGRIEAKVAQSYAHTVAGVYYALTWKVKTTNLRRSPNTEWGQFAKAAFEYAGLRETGPTCPRCCT